MNTNAPPDRCLGGVTFMEVIYNPNSHQNNLKKGLTTQWGCGIILPNQSNR